MSRKRRLNASQRIKEAMRFNERLVLSHVRNQERVEGAYRPVIILNMAWRNALNRLMEKGKVRYDKRKEGYVLVIRRGAKRH